ncbi:MAG: CDP-alcohol phosphatidyltransferase family protein [Longimicrobiales bacterium]|nr:CDP-alcohol phosphatidyltransferase family protein [Longimicrobiales bacterium]
MSFVAVVQIPDRVEAENPAFFRVAGVPLLTRLIAGAHAAGAETIFVTGTGIDRARERVGADPRVRKAPVRWDARPSERAEDRATVIEAPANLVVGTPVWRLLAEAADPDGVPVEVPGAPGMRSRGVGLPCPLWHDAPPSGAWVARVDTREDVPAAKRAIFAHVTKATSGPISRRVNSLLSIPVSRVLCEWGVTPNQMTIFTTLLGLLSAWFFARGTVVDLAIGGTLFQTCAALDRVDGELARSTFKASEKGAWIDTIGDNLVYLAVMIGLNVGYFRFAVDRGWSSRTWIPELGLGTLALLIALIGGMGWYLRSTRQQGTMTAVQHDVADRLEDVKVGTIYRALSALRILGKRDSFSFIAWLVTLLPLLTGDPFGIHLLVAFGNGLVVLTTFYYVWGMIKIARLPEASVPGGSGAAHGSAAS